ncbi:hypothetical protein [Nocardia fluminea]|uniref:hypothetical protein n=1 Tax=Nocardia fluminea TaxID=134984 RepID=UPI003430C50D
MSRYPGNPFWRESDDKPIVIKSAQQWARAKAAGHITPEHVLTRAGGILLGADGQPEWDEDGFDRPVMYEMISALGGAVRMRVYTNDHPPPHAHFERKGYSVTSLKFNLLTGELMNPPAPQGWGPTLKKMRVLLVEHHQPLVELWEKNHGAIDLEINTGLW